MAFLQSFVSYYVCNRYIVGVRGLIWRSSFLRVPLFINLSAQLFNSNMNNNFRMNKSSPRFEAQSKFY
jgi:hypothetical protein